MFELRDFSAFKQHARDFLVQTKSFADKDNAELFAEEATAMREVPSRCPAHGDCMKLEVTVKLQPSSDLYSMLPSQECVAMKALLYASAWQLSTKKLLLTGSLLLRPLHLASCCKNNIFQSSGHCACVIAHELR